MDNQQRIEQISKLLNDALTPSELNVIDDSHLHVGHAGAQSGAGHFTIEIASNAFTGKSRIQQHRLVYDALDTMMPDDIHALRIVVTNNS
ncbi:MAG: BolA family transcriptional regulator [Legionellales bacterium]|nr:BolA family transcriptional regulator [Legionellales bacterium]|tara:strand:+ start:1729 stop:1998 length:270 start_codon:yes stop_codon:yes gene_type:complete